MTTADSTTGSWQRQYITWPDADVFPSDFTYPDWVQSVLGQETVHSHEGWEWERVTDEAAVAEMLETAADLKDTISKVPTALNTLIPLEDGTYLNATVCGQIFARYVTAEEGEFVKISAGQIAANSIGASHISAGAIDGKVITGATIRTSDGTPRIQLDSTSMYAVSGSGTKTFSLDATNGDVYIRGNLGISDSWSEVYYGDVSDYSITDYYGHSQYVWAGCGTRVDVVKWPYDTAYNVSLASQGYICASYRNVTSNSKDNAYKGATYYTGQYGLALSAPTRWSTKPPTLLIEEAGLSFAIQHSSYPVYMSVAPQRFQVRCPTGVGGYRLCVEGGSEACIDVWANENAKRQARLQWYMNWFMMDNEYYCIQGYEPGSSSSDGIAETVLRFRAGHTNSGSDSHSVIYLSNYKANVMTYSVDTRNYNRFRIYAAVSEAYYSIGQNTHSAYARSGKGWHLTGSSFYCFGGVTKNFVMQVPGLTRLKGGLELRHSCTESPANGVEYWENLTLDENGEGVWRLPEYVPYIASGRTARSVFVTCSTGTAAAFLEELDGTNWVIRVREGVPGATASVLLKMGRILDSGKLDAQGYETQWADDPYQVWQLRGAPPEEQAVLKDGTVALSDDGTLEDGQYGPLTKEASRDIDEGLVEAILSL